MSTKTIAVDVRVYQKLADLKQESESFSKLLNRLADRASTAHTGGDILRRLSEAPSALSELEAGVMLDVVRQNRQSEDWTPHGLR